jgi:hypothetical protein
VEFDEIDGQLEDGTADIAEYIADCLHHAKVHQLEAEVVLWALIAMRDNPKLTLEEAMTAGMVEWDL